MDNSSTSSHLHPNMSIKDKVQIANSLFKPLMRKAESVVLGKYKETGRK